MVAEAKIGISDQQGDEKRPHLFVLPQPEPLISTLGEPYNDDPVHPDSLEDVLRGMDVYRQQESDNRVYASTARILRGYIEIPEERIIRETPQLPRNGDVYQWQPKNQNRLRPPHASPLPSVD